MIRTKNKINFDRGKWEIRCIIPKGDGFWCAFWGSGGDEIDVFESGSVQDGKLNEQIHTEYDPNPISTGTDWRALNFNYSADFHTYAIVWDKLYVAWLIDGKEVKRVWGYENWNKDEIGSTYLEKGPYSKLPHFPVDSQCIIANFCVSQHKDFGKVTSNTPNNAAFIIDWIRVYQKNEDIQSTFSDLCDFKLKPIPILCSNSTQYLAIKANADNFTGWSATNVTLASSSASNTSFTPVNIGPVKIIAKTKYFCPNQNTLEFWYGKPKYTIKVAPIPCSKCWKISFEDVDLMKANAVWDIGTTIKYQLEDCTGAFPYSIPATLTSTNACGTLNYSATIKSTSVNCTEGTIGTQYRVPVSTELKMENLLNAAGMESMPRESSRITLIRLSDFSKFEINLDQENLEILTRSKGLYVLYIHTLPSGKTTFLKIIRY